MRLLSFQRQVTSIVTLALLLSVSVATARGSTTLTGHWTIKTSETTFQKQTYPPFQGSFSRATFPLSSLNAFLDTSQTSVLLVEELNSFFLISLPSQCDSLRFSESTQAYRIATPFTATDSLIVTSNTMLSGVGFPIFRLLNQREFDHYLSTRPTTIRSIEKIPVFNRFTHANYDLELHRFENFRRWLKEDSTDPLAAADFFKSINFTINVDGEDLNLPLDAVLIQVDYEPGTAILKIQYLLNDDNILTLTACAPASYTDPIFLIYVELTQHDGQSIAIKGNLELDRPDIAFIDQQLPNAPNLSRHVTVFAHSAESIRIARRYCEIIASDPDQALNRERDWWANWHRFDQQPEGPTSLQAELWTQALTFLEINPLPSDSTKIFENLLQRAWGLSLGGHADEANDELALILDEVQESMTPAQWGQFLAIMNAVANRVGHSQLIKSNWNNMLAGFSEPVIANYNTILQADSLTTDHLYIFAGIHAMAEIAEGFGVPATTYVYQRLSQQIDATFQKKLSALQASDWIELLPAFQWLPKSLTTNPLIYQSLRLNGVVLDEEATVISSNPLEVRQFLQTQVVGKMVGMDTDYMRTSAYPVILQATVNAHLFPKYYTRDGYGFGPDLSAELLTTYLLLLHNSQR